VAVYSVRYSVRVRTDDEWNVQQAWQQASTADEARREYKAEGARTAPRDGRTRRVGDTGYQPLPVCGEP
jgi:hypothetical protein